MSDQSYTVEQHDIDIQPLKKVITPTPGQPQEKPYAKGKNFTVETTNPSAFSFSLLQNKLDFGKLTATNPITRLLYLLTSNQGPYWILAGENHQLQIGDKTIPDTTCDNGSCSEQSYASWTSSLTYGFGYQTKSMPDDSYQQFPDLSKNEHPEVIFFHRSDNNIQDQIIYKVNVAGTQAPGTYSNVVTYLAVPSY